MSSSSREFQVRGVVEAADAARPLELDAFGVRMTPRHTIRTGLARGAAAEPVSIRHDDVVEVELEDGIRLWLSGERLHETLAPSPDRSGVLAPRLRFAAPSRGPGELAVRALRVLGVDFAADAATDLLVGRMEEQLQLGLHRVAAAPGTPQGLRFTEPVTAPAEFANGAPTLIFLHGTASSTSGSFGGLAAANEGRPWQRIAERYGRNVLALEHRTLTLSPIHNALEIARLLPDRATLHLVSHSRGGLVGELLARAHVAGEPFDASRIAALRERSTAAEADALLELNELLRGKRPRIERFLRVACPARGTTLASGRLDLYLSLVLNALRLVPGIGTNPVTGFVTSLVLTVAKKRTRPEELPGLAAMMPTAPLIAILNDPAIEHDADLAVIAGDIQGTGILGRLKVLATDVFYRENHDLVVQTSSMVGGARRVAVVDGRAQAKGRYCFVKGAEVSHFHYFRNRATADRLVAALESESVRDFLPIAETTADELRTRALRAPSADRPVVFLIPGIMGSHLTAKGDRVWIDPFDLAKGEFRRLAIDADGVAAQALVGLAYQRLHDYLSTSCEVIAFPYDWRRSVLDSAKLLAVEVEKALRADRRRPVRLLAHSMGGLVARALVASRSDLWRELVARGGRLLMLGTPNGGSWVIPRVLMGQEQVVKHLATLDFRHDQRTLLRFIAEFPGMLEMLPHDAALGFFGSARWTEARACFDAKWPFPSAERLQQAAVLVQLLSDAGIDPDHMAYVCGRAPATPISYEIDGRRVRYLATAAGDGRVPWSTGRLEGVPTWYMDAGHGDMADHRPSFPAIRELLETGTTTRLATAPAFSRAAADTFELAPAEASEFPTADDVIAAALGRGPVRPAQPAVPELPLDVSVVHGNVAFARYPVAVGHYQDDVIVGAEAVLDRQLSGALSDLRALGRYAGPRGSARVVLRPERYPPGAIVVGLGRVGSLTRASLQESFRQAVLEYASHVAEEQRDVAPDVPVSANITSLLIGSGRGGVGTHDAVSAIIEGTLAARRALLGTQAGARVSIDRLEFCELYEDVAIQALRSLFQLTEDPRTAEQLNVYGEIMERVGARRRTSYEPDRSWWDRMLISETETGSLRFHMLTDRARAESRLHPVDRRIVDVFLEQSLEGGVDDPAVAGALFNLLLPPELRDDTPMRNRLVLVVDEAAARYPWELIVDPREGGAEPLALRVPLLRQLRTAHFREQPESAAGDRALVIGDPTTHWLEPLPGARAEAETVAAALGASGFATTHLDQPEARGALAALLASRYRVLHIAAHGVYEYQVDGRPITGVVLGKELVLSPAVIATMDPIPDLVFINCCHTGFIHEKTRARKLAANVATQLIRNGVRAVIAAGWAVDDDAALTFARSFYQALLQGRRFGDAVHAARCATHAQHPASNTWGAYQCYGDPDFALVQTSPDAAFQHQRFACAAELITELRNLAQDADLAAQFGGRALRERLERLAAAIPESWRQRADVLYALALAYVDLDQFEEAIQTFETLTAVDHPEYVVLANEQLASLRVRYALRRYTDDPRGSRKRKLSSAARKEVADAMSQLRRLRFSKVPSSQQLAARGACYKWLAQLVGTKDERIDALRKMEREYLRAFDAVSPGGTRDPNALFNAIAARIARTRLTGARPGDVEHDLERALNQAQVIERAGGTFWTAVARANALLLLHLARGTMPQQAETVTDIFRAAWKRGGSSSEAAIAIEHLRWLEDVLAGAEQAVPAVQAIGAVRAAVEELAGLTPGARTEK